MTARFDLPREGTDVQAIVDSAFAKKDFCRFLLLRVTNRPNARNWMRLLLDSEPGLIKSLADIPVGDDEVADNSKFPRIRKLLKSNLIRRMMRRPIDKPPASPYPPPFDEAVMVAFSYAGLDQWGLSEHADFPFPTAFRTGMADPKRAALLGDRDRAGWRWGDVEAGWPEVHLLVAHYSKNPFGAIHPLLDESTLPRHGLQAVRVVNTCPYYFREGTEPFGFKDGIAQPSINGLRAGATPKDEKNIVAPGEFVLGHLNSYGERSYCPDVVGWQGFAQRSGKRFARNGSYLAVRQIEQHVEAFAEYTVVDPKDPTRSTRGEKMMGRKLGGAPLVEHPGCPAGAATKSGTSTDPPINDFGYRLGDMEGFECPRGAHIRRANPRDALGWDVESGVAASKLHRLIRRGRVYSDSPTCGAGDTSACASDGAEVGCGSGLFFIALNADLDRQFEFVQQRWFANSKFADLWDESDPALGDGADRSFSIPGCLPVGTRVRNLPQFTTVRGGGYFFLPGLSALKFMAEPPHAVAGKAGPSAGGDVSVTAETTAVE